MISGIVTGESFRVLFVAEQCLNLSKKSVT